jgi:hypothetical protein
MKKWLLFSLLLFGMAGPALSQRDETVITIANVVRKVGRWQRSFCGGYEFNKWIMIGNIDLMEKAIREYNMTVGFVVDPKTVDSNNGQLGVIICGPTGRSCTVYLRWPLKEIRGDTLTGLWHECMHVIFSPREGVLREKLFIRKGEKDCNPGDNYGLYMENVVLHALRWLKTMEDEYGKGIHCDEKKLNKSWDTFAEKLDDCRKNVGNCCCGVTGEEQLSQLRSLTGFDVDPKEIRENYERLYGVNEKGKLMCPRLGATIRVVDKASGRPIDDATVVLKVQPTLDVRYRGKTSDGEVFFPDMEKGNYRAVVSADGYENSGCDVSYNTEGNPVQTIGMMKLKLVDALEKPRKRHREKPGAEPTEVQEKQHGKQSGVKTDNQAICDCLTQWQQSVESEQVDQACRQVRGKECCGGKVVVTSAWRYDPAGGGCVGSYEKQCCVNDPVTKTSKWVKSLVVTGQTLSLGAAQKKCQE